VVGARDPAVADGPQQGADLSFDLEINLEDAAFGLETEIEVPKLGTCDICYGSGAEPGTPRHVCTTCGGSGKIEQTRKTQYGPQVVYTSCSSCLGRGYLIEFPCARCNGYGTLQSAERIFIKVPPGVDIGSKLRLRGKGETGARGGPPGDLYVQIFVREHDIFERHGEEILCEASISFPQAVFGSEIEVPTLEGTAKMRIPPGTQTGTIFRLKGKGIANPSAGGRGDQHVKISISTPSHLNDKQKALLKKYAQATGENI